MFLRSHFSFYLFFFSFFLSLFFFDICSGCYYSLCKMLGVDISIKTSKLFFLFLQKKIKKREKNSFAIFSSRFYFILFYIFFFSIFLPSFFFFLLFLFHASKLREYELFYSHFKGWFLSFFFFLFFSPLLRVIRRNPREVFSLPL